MLSCAADEEGGIQGKAGMLSNGSVPSRQLPSPQDVGIKNATQRRARACRADITRGVLLLHEVFLRALTAAAAGAALNGCRTSDAAADSLAATITRDKGENQAKFCVRGKTARAGRQGTCSCCPTAADTAIAGSAFRQGPSILRKSTTDHVEGSRKRARSSGASALASPGEGVPHHGSELSPSLAEDGTAVAAPIGGGTSVVGGTSDAGRNSVDETQSPLLYDVLEEGQWHPDFEMDDVSVAAVQQALDAARLSPLWTAGRPRVMAPEPGDLHPPLLLDALT